LDSHHHCHTLSHCCLPFFTRLPPPFFATLFPYTTLFRSIRVQELDADLSGPIEGGIDRIVVKDEGHPGLGYVGTYFYKINGKYYLFFIHALRKEWKRVEACFVSDSLEGEFTGGDVLNDDMGYCNQGVAQGGMVDKIGRGSGRERVRRR